MSLLNMINKLLKRSAILCLMFCCCMVKTLALDIECTDCAQVVNGQDTLWVFSGETNLRTKDGSKQDWYYTDGSLLQTETGEVYPESGRGVVVNMNGRSQTVYVFEYADYEPSNLQLIVSDYDCRHTKVDIEGTIPQMTYTRANGSTATYSRTCDISFMGLAWSDAAEEWVDSLVVIKDQRLQIGEFELLSDGQSVPFYQKTAFTLIYNNDQLARALDLMPDSASSPEYTPIAVSQHATHQTAIRGQQGERSNEVERPTDATILSGSAPLDILFKMNPTPAAEFFEWKIKNPTGSTIIRSDEQHRFTFIDPGHYTVVGYVSNAFCPCKDIDDPDCVPTDSAYFEIHISESQLVVPNVFTPNGDGENDEFRVMYRSLREFHCWVYNRWGKLVYQWDDPAKGWDGTINGRPAAEGAYYYVIRALGTDATIDASYGTKIGYNKKRQEQDDSVIGVYRLSGDINLIRGK